VTTTAAPTTTTSRRRASWVVTRHVATRAARQGALWGLVFGVLVVTSVSGFVSAYPTAAQRALLRASLSSNAGAEALLGPTRRIDTVAGFTAWRVLGTAMLVGAVWAILVSTKQTRGEEDAGRWELFLVGPTTRDGATADALQGLGLGLLVMFLATAVVVVAMGQTHDARFGVRASLFFSLSLVAAPALFLAVGVLTSQLAPTRRRAAAIAGGVLGVAFVVRMIASTTRQLHWLRWLSPLGWVDELHPLTGSSVLPLVPLAVTIAVLVAASLRLARARDLGAGALRDRDTARARTALLNGPTGLAVRLTRGVAFGWIAAIGSLALVLGLVAKAAAKSIEQSSNVRDILERLGGRNGGAEAYLGFSFLIVALLVALVAAAQVGATREEEADGRLDNLLVQPVRRTHWLAGRLAVSTALIFACGVSAGLCAWVGAATQDSGVPIGRMLEAGINVVPPALLVLGVGTLMHGVRPRSATMVAYGLVAWSFLVELVGALVKGNHLLLDTSIFHHMRPVPAADPNWTANAVLAVLAVAAAVVGVAVFGRRDLAAA